MIDQIFWSMVAGSAAVAAIFVSVVSTYYARKSFLESHRPIVTARIVFRQSGNMGIAVGLMITNTGNRPAKDVKLIPDWIQLREILAETPEGTITEREEVKRCFSETIPILENGESFFARSAFGFLTDRQERSTWKRYGLSFNLKILYKDFEDSRAFEHPQELKLAENIMFAGTCWGDDDEQPMDTGLRLAKRAVAVMEQIRDRVPKDPPKQHS